MDADDPLLTALMIFAALVMAKWWRDDFRAAALGHMSPRSLPGTTSAPAGAHVIGMAGASMILATETMGEHALGVSAQQSDMTVLFAVYTLAAAFVEELIFRGYLVITGRGRGPLIAGALLASLIFGLLHPFLWSWEDGRLVFYSTSKAWWSTAMAVLGSLWFYFVRFMPANPRHSLLPCVTAHAAKNLGVFLVKLADGHVTGWW